MISSSLYADTPLPIPEPHSGNVSGTGCVREAIHIEGGKAGRGMNSVVQRKLNDRKHRAPRLRLNSTKTAKNIGDDAIYSLSLTVGLRMICCGHVQSRAKHREDGSPKISCEARVAIRDDCWRQPVLTKHTIDKHHSCTFAIDGVLHSR